MVESINGLDGVLVRAERDGEAEVSREVWSASAHFAGGIFSPHSEGEEGEGPETSGRRAGRFPVKLENLELVDGVDVAGGATVRDVTVEGVTMRVWGAERRAEREVEDTERVELDAETETEFGACVEGDNDEDKGEGGWR